jgi:hypothetical protein
MRTPSKVLLGSLFVMFVVVAWQVYGFIKTGTPTQLLVAQQTHIVAAVVVGSVVGIGYERRRASHEGYAIAVYEPTPENDISEQQPHVIPFDTRDVVRTEDGMVVHEYGKERFFGLFRNPKRVGDDRTLRHDPDVRRPAADKIAHEIPKQAVEVRDGVYVWKTKGQNVSKSPETVPDYTYQPPFALSRAEAMQYAADMEMMEDQLEHTKAKNAHLNGLIRELRSQVKQHREETWRDIVPIVREIVTMFPGRATRRRRVGTQNGTTHSRSDDEGVDDDDLEVDGLAALDGAANGRGGR